MTTEYSRPVERHYPLVIDNKISLNPAAGRVRTTQYRNSREYVNNLPYDVAILTELNEVIIIRSLDSSESERAGRRFSNDCFVVAERREWIKNKIKFDTEELLSVRDRPGVKRKDQVDTREEYFNMVDNLIVDMERTAPYGTELVLEIATTSHRRDLNNLKNPLYIKEANIVIFDPNKGLPKNFRHPLSDINRYHENVDVVLAEDNGESMLFKAHAVSNGSHPKPLYINVADNVFEIPIRESEITSEEGVYISHVGSTTDIRDGRKLVPETVVEHLTFEEARENFGIYDSKIDAVNHHDKLATEKKIKLQELAQEVNEVKHQSEIEAKKLSMDYNRDYYTQKSNHLDRKDSSEIIGWLPKIATGVAATIGAVATAAWTFGKLFSAPVAFASSLGMLFSLF